MCTKCGVRHGAPRGKRCSGLHTPSRDQSPVNVDFRTPAPADRPTAPPSAFLRGTPEHIASLREAIEAEKRVATTEEEVLDLEKELASLKATRDAGSFIASNDPPSQSPHLSLQVPTPPSHVPAPSTHQHVPQGPTSAGHHNPALQPSQLSYMPGPHLVQVPGQNTWVLAPPTHTDVPAQGKGHALVTPNPSQPGLGQYLMPAYMPAPLKCSMHPLDYLKVNNKAPDKPSYRDFMWGALEYAQSLPDENVKGYLKHLAFVAAKAKSNIYTTEALLAYDKAVHDKVDRGEAIFGASDGDLATLHLGLDGTFSVARASQSAGKPGNRKKKTESAACGYYNTGSCTRKVCPYKHVCSKCFSKDHRSPDCTEKAKEA